MQEAFEHKMEISRRVATTELEEINVGTTEDPRTISIAKNLPPTTRSTMIALLHGVKVILADAWKSGMTTGVSN